MHASWLLTPRWQHPRCSVAMGRLDAFYEIGFGGPWDVAAAALILEEAGGGVADPAGGPFNLQSRRVLGANSRLIGPLARIIAGAKCSAAEPQPLQEARMHDQA